MLHRRLSHSSAQVGSYLFISGGHDGSEYALDLLLFNLGKLSSLMPGLSPAPPNTNNHKIKYSQQFASHYDTVFLQYEPRLTLGHPTVPRGYHASILADSRLFAFGGFNGHEVFDDVHILELAAAVYFPQVTNFSIDAQ